MNCPNCNNPINPEDKFCGNCGFNLSEFKNKKLKEKFSLYKDRYLWPIIFLINHIIITTFLFIAPNSNFFYIIPSNEFTSYNFLVYLLEALPFSTIAFIFLWAVYNFINLILSLVRDSSLNKRERFMQITVYVFFTFLFLVIYLGFIWPGVKEIIYLSNIVKYTSGTEKMKMIIKMIQAGIENERLENEAKNEAKRVFKVLKKQGTQAFNEELYKLEERNEDFKEKFVYYFKQLDLEDKLKQYGLEPTIKQMPVKQRAIYLDAVFQTIKERQGEEALDEAMATLEELGVLTEEVVEEIIKFKESRQLIGVQQ